MCFELEILISRNWKKIIDILVSDKSSRFNLSDMPIWINKNNIPDIYKYYPKLVNGKSIHKGDLDLTDKIVLKTDKYIIDEKILEISDSEFTLDGKIYGSKLHSFLNFNDKHNLFMTNNNPVEFSIIKDNKLASIFKYENNILDNLKLHGPTVKFFSGI